MGIFDKLMNKIVPAKSIPLYSPTQQSQSVQQNQTFNTFGEPLNQLVDGDLPWGWVTANRAFIDKIQNEYSYFLTQWNTCNDRAPIERLAILKSLLRYISDVQKLCASKDECYQLWCNEYLLNAKQLNELQSECKYLSENINTLQTDYQNKEKQLMTLDDDLYAFLLKHPGIIQKDIYNHFPFDIKGVIADTLYAWDKTGKIKRTKSGNSYIIYTR